MTGKMEEVLIKVLNDNQIFDSPYDKNIKGNVPKLFEGEDWRQLKTLFEQGNEQEFNIRVDDRLKQVGEVLRNAYKANNIKNTWECDNKTRELTRQAEGLKQAFKESRNILYQLLNTLNWYGLAECKLPTMDNYGKVVERYQIAIVEEFFIDKIKSEEYSTKSNALRRTLEYIKELYNCGIEVEEIAFFVRKLNSLEEYWKIITSSDRKKSHNKFEGGRRYE